LRDQATYGDVCAQVSLYAQDDRIGQRHLHAVVDVVRDLLNADVGLAQVLVVGMGLVRVLEQILWWWYPEGESHRMGWCGSGAYLNEERVAWDPLHGHDEIRRQAQALGLGETAAYLQYTTLAHTPQTHDTHSRTRTISTQHSVQEEVGSECLDEMGESGRGGLQAIEVAHGIVVVTAVLAVALQMWALFHRAHSTRRTRRTHRTHRT
jgi:hypothetical protein